MTASPRTSGRHLAVLGLPFLAVGLLSAHAVDLRGEKNRASAGPAVQQPLAMQGSAGSGNDEDPFAALGLDRSPRPDLTFLFSGGLGGFLEPCGCTAGRLGGLDRLVSHVRDGHGKADRVVYVETGDVFLHAGDESKALVRQLPLKADAMFELLSESGCVGVAVGDSDLVLGPEQLQELGRKHGVPLLCANIVDGDGDFVFERSVVVEREGVRIGIFGLLAQNLVHPDLENDSVLRVGALAEQMNLRILPWREVAQRMVTELRSEVDVLVCASHLGGENSMELARLQPQIDIVCGPHLAGREAPHDVVGSTVVSHTTAKGARVTEMDFWFGDEPPTPQRRILEGATDESLRVVDEVRLAVSHDALFNLKGREGVLGTAEHQRLELFNRMLIESHRELLEERGAFADGRAFAVSKPTIDRNNERDEAVLRRIDEYHGDLATFWTRSGMRDVHDGEVYADPATCTACHPEQYEFWKSTRHARAYSTLEVTQQQFDGECFRCHTVGFGERGGFQAPPQASGYENVQCSACHGPGARHMAGGASYVDDRRLETVGTTCIQCHDERHDPEFYSWVERRPETDPLIEAKIRRVACPKMPAPGQGTTRFKASLVEAASTLRERGSPDWPEIVRLFHRAGDLDSAIESARRAIDEFPVKGPGERILGMLLVEAGQPDDAVPYLRTALEQLGPDAQVHFMLARALLVTDAQEALIQAREAYALEPQQAAHAEAVARALDLTGDRGGALAFLDAHVGRFAVHAELIAPLRAEIAER